MVQCDPKKKKNRLFHFDGSMTSSKKQRSFQWINGTKKTKKKLKKNLREKSFSTRLNRDLDENGFFELKNNCFFSNSLGSMTQKKKVRKKIRGENRFRRD